MPDELQQPQENSEPTPVVETPSEQEDASPSPEESSQDQPRHEEQRFQWAGRELTSNELFEEARKLQADHTKKSQRLSEYESRFQELNQRPATRADPFAEYSPEQRIELEQAAKQLSPFLAPALQEQMNTLVEQRLNQTLQEKERVQTYQKQFDETEALAKTAGIPFDREEMVDYMKSANNWNVMDAFRSRNFEKLMDYQLAQRKAQEKKLPTVNGKKAAPQSAPADKVKDLTDTNFKNSLTQKLATMLGQG